MSFKRIHIFESRKKAFGDDNVLQENIIYHAVRGLQKPKSITISTSDGLDFDKARTYQLNKWWQPGLGAIFSRVIFLKKV